MNVGLAVTEGVLFLDCLSHNSFLTQILLVQYWT